MIDKPIALFLCNKTITMPAPWLQAGFECWMVDTQHPAGEHRLGNLVTVGADIRTWLPPRRDYVFACAFPPCTNLAVSGARWFTEKGLAGLSEAIALVERSHMILQWTGAPYMLENPISTLSTYWRKPDYIFDPWQYGDGYTKKTCLWTGNDFVMPAPWVEVKPDDVDDRIHKAPPGPGRADFRSITPPGFAKATFLANAPSLVAA